MDAETGVVKVSGHEIVRPTVASVRARLAEAGLDVTDACVPGILANLIVLQNHMRTVRDFTVDDHRRVALKFEP